MSSLACGLISSPAKPRRHGAFGKRVGWGGAEIKEQELPMPRFQRELEVSLETKAEKKHREKKPAPWTHSAFSAHAAMSEGG